MNEHINKIREEVADMELLICTRVWEAWHYGTMSEDDFMQAADDTDAIQRLTDIARTVTAGQVEAAAEAHYDRTEEAEDYGEEFEFIPEDRPRAYREMSKAIFRAAGFLIEGDDHAQ